MLNEKDKEWLTNLIDIMVEEKIARKLPKEKTWVKWIRNWFMGLTPLAIIGAVWVSARMFNQMKETRFDDSAQKANVIRHVEAAPDPVILDLIKRHATDPGVHMPKDAKDSTYVRSDIFNEYAKGVNYDIFQMRKAMEKNSEAQIQFYGEMKKSIDALDYKIERAIN